jgi:hypothetical protein
MMACTEYIYDPLELKVPKYTEVGRNDAGAIINNDLWTSLREYYFICGFPCNPNNVHCNITTYLNGDSVFIDLEGFMREGVNSQKIYMIRFVLKNNNIQDTTQLSRIKDKKYDLGSVNAQAYLLNSIDDSTPATYISKSIKGNLTLGNTKEGIFSGAFGFDTVDGTKVHFGRFDFKAIDYEVVP